MEKVFRPSQTRSTIVWGIILVAIINVPLLLLFFFGFQGATFLFVILTIILILIDALVLSLSFLGMRMSYNLGENEFSVNFYFSKRRIPFSVIRDVKISKTTLLLRLFGASWPGLHWGFYKAKDVGKVWVYSTRMSGEFVVVELVDSTKVAVSPENPERLFNEINALRSRFGTSIPSEVEGFEASTRLVHFQVAIVVAAFFAFLGYLLWIYPSLPEIIPLHFDFNLIPNRWGHKSELFIITSVAAIFPIMNTILALKFGKYGKVLIIFLGIIFVSVIILFFGILYFTQSVI